jgi:hypothetical protein
MDDWVVNVDQFWLMASDMDDRDKCLISFGQWNQRRMTGLLFLHKTCLLVKFICHLIKIIYLSYELVFCWNVVGWYVFKSGIQQNWVCIKWTSVTQDIQVGMVEGQHWQNARFDFEGCNFHALSFFFYFLSIYV